MSLLKQIKKLKKTRWGQASEVFKHRTGINQRGFTADILYIYIYSLLLCMVNMVFRLQHSPLAAFRSALAYGYGTSQQPACSFLASLSFSPLPLVSTVCTTKAMNTETAPDIYLSGIIHCIALCAWKTKSQLFFFNLNKKERKPVRLFYVVLWHHRWSGWPQAA